MTITLTPDIESALTERAQKQGTEPEALALERLRAEFVEGGALENDFASRTKR